SRQARPMAQLAAHDESVVAVQLRALPADAVRDLAGRATGRALATPGKWSWCQIYGGGTPPTIGVYRLTGVGRDRMGGAVRWSAVLKAVRRPTGGTGGTGASVAGGSAGLDDPSARDYWKREILAYQSGWLADLPGPLAAPRCLGVSELPGDTVFLWLEDLRTPSTASDGSAASAGSGGATGDGAEGVPWPLGRYALAARHFGVLNGTYLARRPLPRYAWLRPPVKMVNLPESALCPDIHLIRDAATWRDPGLGGVFGPAMADRLLAQWERRGALFDAFLQLPQTLCHWDAHRRNLFARRAPRGQEATVAIDWASVGAGPIGAELNNLVLGSIIVKAIDAADGARLNAAVFPAYVDGLRRAGWRGDRHLARFGFTASAALAVAPTLHWFLAGVLEQGGRGGPEETFPVPTAGQLARWHGLTELALNLGDEALALCAAL
ncbi:MAG: phosphotransferase, partial [Chloroflexota bacterium]